MDIHIDPVRIHALIVSEIADVISESEKQYLDALLRQSTEARIIYAQIKGVVSHDKIRQAEERMGPDMAWKIIAEVNRKRQLRRKRICSAAALFIIALFTYYIYKQ